MLETTNGTNVNLTAEQVLETARALIPVVRERGPLGDAARKLPEETVEDFKRLGLVRTVQPARFGGMEHDLETLHLASMEIARGDGASGWLSSFFGIHQFNVGWFPLEAQEEYWADGPNTLSSTVAAMHFAREEVPGGLRISGRGKFSSGIDYAEWLLLFTQKEGCLIPRSDFEIIDDWQVSGLHGNRGARGCSSKTSPSRIIESCGWSSSRISHTTGPPVRLSLYGAACKPNAVGHAIIFPLLGMARGVADIFESASATAGSSSRSARHRAARPERCGSPNRLPSWTWRSRWRSATSLRSFVERRCGASRSRSRRVRRSAATSPTRRICLQSTNRLVNDRTRAGLT